MNLEVGNIYKLSGLRNLVWDNKHEKFGQPSEIAGIYLGFLSGERTWHLFEIRYSNKEVGVILMNNSDLEKIIIEKL